MRFFPSSRPKLSQRSPISFILAANPLAAATNTGVSLPTAAPHIELIAVNAESERRTSFSLRSLDDEEEVMEEAEDEAWICGEGGGFSTTAATTGAGAGAGGLRLVL